MANRRQHKNPTWLTIFILTFLFYWLPKISFTNNDLEFYGVLGRFIIEYQTIIRNTYLIVMIIHLIECVVAAMICSYMDLDGKSTFQWTLSVFIHGVFSFWPLMGVLLDYESCRQTPLTPAMKFGLEDFGH